MDWFLYDRDLRHERDKGAVLNDCREESEFQTFLLFKILTEDAKEEGEEAKLALCCIVGVEANFPFLSNLTEWVESQYLYSLLLWA